jgi:hypothetical protein
MPDAAEAAAAEAVVDPALQAAVDAGEPEKVTELLKTLAGALSKSAQKKLVKSAEINKKKRDQGKAPQAAAAPAGKAKAAPAAAPAASAAASAASAAAPPAAGGGAGTSTCGDEHVVADVLACLRALALPELPDAALQALGARSDALGAAIAPRLNAMRNDAYVKGYSARAK